MTRTQYYCAASLDGYIADRDGTIGWLTGYAGRYEGADAEPGPMSPGGAYERFFAGVGALVSGSATYEYVLEHGGDVWPYPDKPWWVLSSRILPRPGAARADVRVVAGEVTDLHPAVVESAAGANVWIVGGGGVASQYADARLLDEVLLTVVPVVLGDGKPLFERGLSDAMRLTGSRVFETGMVELRYELGR